MNTKNISLKSNDIIKLFFDTLQPPSFYRIVKINKDGILLSNSLENFNTAIKSEAFYIKADFINNDKFKAKFKKGDKIKLKSTNGKEYICYFLYQIGKNSLAITFNKKELNNPLTKLFQILFK